MLTLKKMQLEFESGPDLCPSLVLEGPGELLLPLQFSRRLFHLVSPPLLHFVLRSQGEQMALASQEASSLRLYGGGPLASGR